MLEHHLCSLSQFGCGDGRNGMAWVESEEMIDVAMLVLRVVDVLRPFHQLSVTSNLIRSQMLQRVLPLAALLGVLAECAVCLNSVEENLTDDGVGEGGSLIHGSVFGRGGRCGCIYSVGTMPQIVSGKVGASLQNVIIFGKETTVAGKVIIVPEMSGEPRSGKRREVPRHVLAGKGRGESEDIARHGCGPSTCTEV